MNEFLVAWTVTLGPEIVAHPSELCFVRGTFFHLFWSATGMLALCCFLGFFELIGF